MKYLGINTCVKDFMMTIIFMMKLIKEDLSKYRGILGLWIRRLGIVEKC